MAGYIPSFVSGANLVIRIGDAVIAYATNLAFGDNMAVAPVFGIGSFGADAIEPLRYSAGGSMTITRYSTKAWLASQARGKALPGRVMTNQSKNRDGNSLFTINTFSPAYMIISRTFDIDVYARTQLKSTDAVPEGTLLYQIKDARLTSYSMTFTPGTVVQENVTFLAMKVIDYGTERSNK